MVSCSDYLYWLPSEIVKSCLSLDPECRSGFAFLCLNFRGASAPSNSVGSSGEVRELRQSVVILAASIRDLVRDIAALRLEHRSEIAALREEIRILRSDRLQPSDGPGDLSAPMV